MFNEKDINLHQRIWKEFMKDFNLIILYHLYKTNIVVDALRRLPIGSVSHLKDEKKKLVHEVHSLAGLGVWLVNSTEGNILI